jgi:hypothetical protein
VSVRAISANSPSVLRETCASVTVTPVIDGDGA